MGDRPPAALSLGEILRWRAERTPDRVAYAFLKDGEADESAVTYRQLDARAAAVAARLREHGAEGRRALLVHPPGLEFPAAFFGCLYAGVVPVACSPPGSGAFTDRVERFAGIAAHVEPAAVVGPSATLARLPEPLREQPALRDAVWIGDDELAGPSDGVAPVSPRPDDLAYLQYTSGSTTRPRGVMVGHRALLEQLELYRLRAGPDWRETVMVGWLPHQHDFGLVGFVLSAISMGVPYHFMAPVSFLRRPARWPEAISRLRGTYSGAPSFAYDLCARLPDEATSPGLDLGCWSIASIGGEPIAPETLDRFAARYRPHGFDPAAFLPSYGLAEAVLCVTARSGVATSRSDERRRVSVGSVLPGQELLVVDPEARTACAPGEVGEIWVAGRSLAAGYWRDPDETARSFAAALAGSGAGPYLRTGDLGYVRDGELFVTGRLKDVLVVRGRNHHAHDVERTVQSVHPSLRPGCGAAFLDDRDGEERVVVLQEIRRNPGIDPVAAIARARAAVAEAHGLRVDTLELIASGSLPRTPSGKVQRHAARAAYRAGPLRTVASGRGSTAPRDEPSALEQTLAAIWSEVLDVPRVGVDDDFFALGGDSLAIQRVLAAVSDRLGAELPVRALFEQRTVARLAAHLERVRPVAPEPEPEPPHELMRQVLERLDRLETLIVELMGAEAAPGDTGDLPLTDGQREIRQLAALAPEAASALHVLAVLELADPDEEALRRALEQVVDRHEALRTVLAADGLHTTVEPTMGVELPVVELAGEDVVEWLRAERRRGFELTLGPLWRAHLLLGERARLVLTAHHLIADGTSIRILAEELGACYVAAREGRTCELPAPMQYREHVAERARRATPEAMAAHRRYWLAELGPDLPVLELPSDRPRPRSPTFAGANHGVWLSDSVRAEAERLAQRHGCTLFMALLAAYSALLHRLSGQEEFLLGFASAGRDAPGSERVVGSCSSDLPILSRAPGEATVADHLGRIRESVLGALEHQDCTLAMLLDEVRAPVDPGRPLRVATAFNLQAIPAGTGPFGADLDLQARSVGQSLSDVEVNAVDTGGRLRLDFAYNTAVFDEPAVRRIATCFETLLQAMAADGDRRLDELPLIPPEEELLLLGWSRGPEPRVTDSVPRLFRARAAAVPDAVAASDEDGELTYRELGSAVDAMRVALGEHGVGPGTLTAVLARRGIGYLAAMLGILEAGGVLLPLDPRDPDERLRSLLRQSGTSVLVAGDGFEDAAAAAVEGLDARLLRLADALACAGAPPAGPEIGARDPAYVIFTSGSTGAPKGAVVAHEGMVNHLWAKIDQLGLTSADTVAQTAPQSFDISIWQFLAPLLAGAAVRVVPDEATDDPARLLDALDRHRVTIFETVPSTLRALLDDAVQRRAGRPRLEALRWIVPTGEALPPELCRRWLSHYPKVPLLNAYGPAECSDDVTHHVVDWPPAHDAVRVPIGRPIPGARLSVLDARRRLVPAGTPGELYVGGVCVGLGYLNDPERTAQAFVPDPFAEGETLYRTGDLVRYRADGCLEFLGRIDDQEKIKGVRVEPGEVEAILGQHPAVRECAVAVRRTADGSNALAGYVACHNGAPPVGELRYFVRTRLPHYLVPKTFTFLESVPRNANGKVDRAALPDPAPEERRSATGAAPRTEVERGVAAIWAETLRHRDFGVHDDFFELGGRSLDAVQIVSRLGATFGVELPVFQVYREPTLGGIAGLVEAAMAAPARDRAVSS